MEYESRKVSFIRHQTLKFGLPTSSFGSPTSSFCSPTSPFWCADLSVLLPNLFVLLTNLSVWFANLFVLLTDLSVFCAHISVLLTDLFVLLADLLVFKAYICRHKDNQEKTDRQINKQVEPIRTKEKTPAHNIINPSNVSDNIGGDLIQMNKNDKRRNSN